MKSKLSEFTFALRQIQPEETCPQGVLLDSQASTFGLPEYSTALIKKQGRLVLRQSTSTPLLVQSIWFRDDVVKGRRRRISARWNASPTYPDAPKMSVSKENSKLNGLLRHFVNGREEEIPLFQTHERRLNKMQAGLRYY